MGEHQMTPTLRMRTPLLAALAVGLVWLGVCELLALEYEVINVVALAANVRFGPGTDCGIGFVAEWGDELLVIDREDPPWIRVHSPARKIGGWVHRSLVSSDNPEWRGSGSAAGVKFEYSRDLDPLDSFEVRLSPPVPWDTEHAGPVLLGIVARAFGERVESESLQVVVGVAGAYVDGDARRYRFLAAQLDSIGVESLRAWAEPRSGLPN